MLAFWLRADRSKIAFFITRHHTDQTIKRSFQDWKIFHFIAQKHIFSQGRRRGALTMYLIRIKYVQKIVQPYIIMTYIQRPYASSITFNLREKWKGPSASPSSQKKKWSMRTYTTTYTPKKKLGKLILMRDHHVAVVPNAKDCTIYERCSANPKKKGRWGGNTFGNNYRTRWGWFGSFLCSQTRDPYSRN